MSIPLSIVDFSHVPEGGGVSDAMRNTVDLARRADRLGYKRFWLAEHHGAYAQSASCCPEVSIAQVAASTSKIRVGSGALLINYYSPFKVAETFKMLSCMNPNRIDLGLGHASGGPLVDCALYRESGQMGNRGDFSQKVEEVCTWLSNSFPETNPFSRLRLMADDDTTPEIWVLGSGPRSAQMAGELGINYCYAGFINPVLAVESAKVYRSSLVAGRVTSPDPKFAIAIGVCVAESEDEAAELRSTAEACAVRVQQRVQVIESLPLPEKAMQELGGRPPKSVVAPGSWPARISGSPSQVAEMIRIICDDVDADEVIIQDQIACHQARLYSYGLLARMLK